MAHNLMAHIYMTRVMMFHILMAFHLMVFARVAILSRSKVDEKNVLVLDESNFQQALEDNGVILLEFFAPWCGNCKRLQPRYARAADALVKEGNVARLAKVDILAVAVGVIGGARYRYLSSCSMSVQ